jgi:hypothetical protein
MRDPAARPAARRPFLGRLALSALFTAAVTASVAAGAGAAQRAGWFQLRGITPGELTLAVAAAAVGGVLFQMLLAFLVPLVFRGARVTLLARLKLLLAFPVLVAAAAGAGYLVLRAEQREVVDAAAGTLAREAEREAKAFDARAEAERAAAAVRAGRRPGTRTLCLMAALLAAAAAGAAALAEVARWAAGPGRRGGGAETPSRRV